MTTPTTVNVRLKLRSDTASNWTSANPTLLTGELGRETDTGKIKIGNGSTAWTSLAYQGLIPNTGIYPLSQLLLPAGTVSAPSLAFDGDVNVGIYKSGTDQLAITTNGVERVEWGTTEAVFNDGGENYDFRIEGDTNANLFFVDASTDRVGVNDSTPDALLTVNGVASFGAGSAGAPSIAARGDLNTGVYFPGADQVAISTGGTGRLFIDANGGIGVGAASSAWRSTEKHIQIGNVASLTSISNLTTVLRNNTYINTSNQELLLFDGYASAYQQRKDSGNHSWFTRNTSGLAGDSGALTEKMTLTAAGFVGIGTSAPNSLLEIAASSPTLTIRDTATSVTTASPKLRLAESGAGTAVDQYWDIAADNTGSDFSFQIKRQTSTYFHIAGTTGRVGIGTTSPAAPLTIGSIGYSTTDRASALRLLDVGGTNGNNYGFGLDNTVGGFYRTAGTGGFHAWLTANTERARIDTSGRLLVGTSIYSGNSAFVIKGGAAQNVGLVDVRYGTTRPTTADVQVSEIRFGSTDFTSNSAYANIQCVTDGASSSDADIPGRLVFSTTADGASSPTERMRINSSGECGVFTADVSGLACFEASQAGGAGATRLLFQGRYGATGIYSGTESFRVESSGDVKNTNNSYGAISDIKLKENIVDANSQWDDIKALQVRNYNFKEGQTHTQIGLVAQEVELVSPGLVSESPDRDEDGNDLGTVTKSVNYSVLYMKAVKALQEAMERIETLEASNTDLLARVSALESA